jgi:hypothetical protein
VNSADLHRLLRQRYSAVSPGNGPRYVLAPEVRNQAGFGGYGGDGRLRSCDLMVMDTWQSGPVRLIGHELKCSRSDWRRELEDPSKAGAFLPFVAEWWLVISDRKIVRDGELPEGWGLIAPAGDSLRAVVKAARKPQAQIPTGMLAALMRSVQATTKAELALARVPKPHTLKSMPMLGSFESYPYDAVSTDIAKPRYDLRRRR